MKMKKAMKLAKFKACICEGAAESYNGHSVRE